MKMQTGLMLAAAIAAAAVSASATGQRFVGETEASRAAEDNRTICKTQARAGTRILSRTCLTNWQWERIRILQQRALREVADRPLHEQPERLAAQTQDR
jgi:hypothetical protein